MTYTKTTITARDGLGVDKQFRAFEDGDSYLIMEHLPPEPIIATSSVYTRPANTTQYEDGDVIANSTTIGSVTIPTISCGRGDGITSTLKRIRLKSSSTTMQDCRFRIHLFNSLPTLTNPDNGAFLATSTGYCGAVDVKLSTVFSDGIIGTATPNDSEMFFTPKSGTSDLYFIIQVLGTYTPESEETFTLTTETI